MGRAEGWMLLLASGQQPSRAMLGCSVGKGTTRRGLGGAEQGPLPSTALGDAGGKSIMDNSIK